jgi:hypothetical protein
MFVTLGAFDRYDKAIGMTTNVRYIKIVEK